MIEQHRLCVICQRRELPESRPMVCVLCQNQLGHTLDEIPGLYHRVGPDTRARTGGPKVTTSRVPPVPVNLDYLDLTGPLNAAALTITVTEDTVGNVALKTELDFWVKDWAGELDQDLPEAYVHHMAPWLRERLNWACDNHHAIDEFATQMHRIHGTLTHHAGQDDERITVGPCPAVIGDRECRATLKADPYLDVIECPRCTTRWPRERWLILAAAARQSA